MLETKLDLRAGNRENTVETLQSILASSLFIDPVAIKPASRLIADLGADSLDFVDLLFKIEKRFGIELHHGEFDFFSALDSSSRDLTPDGFLTPESLQKLTAWLPALAELPDPQRVTPGQLFSLLTVDSLVFMVERNRKS